MSREASRIRIPVGRAVRFAKIFRILSECYRNRRNRFVFRLPLIAGICDFVCLNQALFEKCQNTVSRYLFPSGFRWVPLKSIRIPAENCPA